MSSLTAWNQEMLAHLRMEVAHQKYPHRKERSYSKNLNCSETSGPSLLLSMTYFFAKPSGSMFFRIVDLCLQWFLMAANHWSNDAIFAMYCSTSIILTLEKNRVTSLYYITIINFNSIIPCKYIGLHHGQWEVSYLFTYIWGGVCVSFSFCQVTSIILI